VVNGFSEEFVGLIYNNNVMEKHTKKTRLSCSTRDQKYHIHLKFLAVWGSGIAMPLSPDNKKSVLFFLSHLLRFCPHLSQFVTF